MVVSKSIYVSMKDTFMSGWGHADGQSNIFQVECDNDEQVQQIIRAATNRDEMRTIRTSRIKRKNTKTQLVTNRHFNDLGEIWTGHTPKTTSSDCITGTDEVTA